MTIDDSRVATQVGVRSLSIALIKRDPQTQHRAVHDPSLVSEYAVLMRAGVVFPPDTVWWDGNDYSLSDGNNRLDAVALAGRVDFDVENHKGTREDALWLSLAANATHGTRRAVAETQTVVRRALRHTSAARPSNVHIAEHLQLDDGTARYWRKNLSSENPEDSVCLVERGGSVYEQNCANIGKDGAASRKHRRDLSAEFDAMRPGARETAVSVFNIMEHWPQGYTTPEECAKAILRVLPCCAKGKTSVVARPAPAPPTLALTTGGRSVRTALPHSGCWAGAAAQAKEGQDG